MKIPIPKEALTQIMNDYNFSEEQAAKAYLDAQDKANETVKSFLAELVGRSPIKTFVNLLSKNDLIRIMQETEDSILNPYKLEFKLFNIEVAFLLEAIEYVA